MRAVTLRLQGAFLLNTKVLKQLSRSNSHLFRTLEIKKNNNNFEKHMLEDILDRKSCRFNSSELSNHCFHYDRQQQNADCLCLMGLPFARQILLATAEKRVNFYGFLKRVHTAL